MKIVIALQWRKVWHEINEPCANVIFVIKHISLDDGKHWAVVHFDATSKDGMKLIDTFYQFETAYLFAESKIS